MGGPIAIGPAAASVSPRRISASSGYSRVMSRTTATAAVTAPLFPASGAVTMLPCRGRPSGVSTSASASGRLSPVISVSLR